MREIHTIQPILRISAAPANHHGPFTSKLQPPTPRTLYLCPFQSFKSATTEPPPPAAARAKASISLLTMASKLNPFLLRSGVRCASRAAAARPQIRAFSITASRPSDTLQVVSKRSRSSAMLLYIYPLSYCQWCFLYLFATGG